MLQNELGARKIFFVCARIGPDTEASPEHGRILNKKKPPNMWLKYLPEQFDYLLPATLPLQIIILDNILDQYVR